MKSPCKKKPKQLGRLFDSSKAKHVGGCQLMTPNKDHKSKYLCIYICILIQFDFSVCRNIALSREGFEIQVTF